MQKTVAMSDVRICACLTTPDDQGNRVRRDEFVRTRRSAAELRFIRLFAFGYYSVTILLPPDDQLADRPLIADDLLLPLNRLQSTPNKRDDHCINLTGADV